MSRAVRHPSVRALLAVSPDGISAAEAMRLRVRTLIADVHAIATWEGPPFDLNAIASFRGFVVRATDGFSPLQDACITPGLIAVNRRKPTVRQRFSVAHEIVHTLFPDYAETLARAGALWRDESRSAASEADDAEVEHLCQVGAAELLMPDFAFTPRLRAAGLSIDTILDLSATFEASIEATARRAIECTTDRAMTVFVQPWDAETSSSTRDYAPYADLRVTRSYPSPASSAWRLPIGSPVPTRSAAARVWKRASHRGLDLDLGVSRETWPALGDGTQAVGDVLAQALALPDRSTTPGEVLVLLRLAARDGHP